MKHLKNQFQGHLPQFEETPGNIEVKWSLEIEVPSNNQVLATEY